MEFKFNKKNISPKLQLHTDPVRLKQLFDNLITNALKYTPSGQVTIGVHEFNKPEKYLTFFVEDTGVGIDDQHKDLIFSRFLQIGNELPREGTGLGLSITKGIMNLLGGEIWFESAKGKGSTFYFKIPWEPVSFTPEVEENKHVENTLKLSGKTIFIAEDDHPSFLFLKEVLKNTEAEIEHFVNGQLLVEAVKNKKPDLILADINMPILNGIDAIRKIREMGFEGPIIAQTAYAMPEERQKCLNAQCNGYISKPINIKELLNITYKYLG